MERFSFGYLKLIFQKNSLTRQFVFSLAIVLILFAFIASGLSYYYTAITLRHELDHDAEAHMRTLASVIAKPLAERDLETLHTISNTYLSHHIVKAITIKDRNNNIAIRITAPLSDAAKMVKTSIVKFQDELIGEVTVIFSLKEYEEQLRRLVLISLAIFISAALVIFAATTWLLNHFLQTPLANLQHQVQALANFQEPNLLNERIVPELQPLQHAIYAAADTIRQKETELLEQRSLLRTLVDNLPTLVYIKDTQARKVLANTKDVTYCGAQHEADILGKTDLELFPAEIGAAFYADDMAVIHEGKTILNKKEKILLPNGELRWLLTSKVPFFDQHGKVIGLIGVGRDITEVITQQEELSRRAEILEQLYRAGTQLNRTLSIDDVYNTFCTCIRSMLRVDELYIFQFDAYAQMLTCGYFCLQGEAQNAHQMRALSILLKSQEELAKLPEQSTFSSPFSCYNALISQLFYGTQPLLITDQRELDSILEVLCSLKQNSPEEDQPLPSELRDYGAVILVPLLFEGKVQGIIHVISYEREAYQESQLRFLEALAIFTANALTNARLYQQAKEELAERRQAEAALARERTLLRTLIEHIPDGIYAMDAQGRKILSNRADLLNMGAQFEFEVLGKTDLEWFGEAGKQYYEDDMYVIRSGVPIINKEEHAVSKKGRQRWVLTTKLPLRDSQGNIIGLVGIGRDITEQKLANQALKESERLFRQLLDLIPHYISIKDSEGKFIIVNSALAKSFEMTPEELIGRSLLDVAMDQAEARFTLENDQQVIAGRIIQTFKDQTYTDRFGIIHWLEVTKVPIEVRGKTAVLEIGIDVTNYKLTEAALRESETRYRLLNEELERRVQERTAQLQAANQELESFSYSVSHDLRAPLRTLDGFSLALLEDYAEQLDEQGRNYLQRIRSASQRMAALIDDLLMLSRVTRAEMQIVAINLSQIARSIIEEWQAEQPYRKVTFIAPSEIIVQADRNLMGILLTNLLSNAWKFTSKHPSATIELGEFWQNGQRVIFVRDDGAGFDMAYSDRLFKAFQRLHTDAEFEGTGIGLATVQRIVLRHGGKIWAHSEVERGTTFFFILPH